ncbi:YciI family protein [Dyella flagellata]|uniref:YCII-related domain-containing protein n=1 Tax=Dyella flagellata TaxID=1867833 RepID=A0ABQ5XJF6_9GAMM|nr:YciI family protein [Dyella flagellata]GLQ90756.1 hypothetical protein GCM10007898_43320 [Dyella flagellata]
MFIVLLRFSAHQADAGRFMEGHNAWLKRGFDDQVFLLAGSLQPKLGGAIVAHGSSLQELQQRVNDDPFVVADVVTAEIMQITPSKASEQMAFLLR